MKTTNIGLKCNVVLLALSMLAIGPAGAATIDGLSVFASGDAVHATAPDSITSANDTIWVSYANNADSTGLAGNSTIVEYDLQGKVLKILSLKGSVDGLKFDPETQLIWALQNQDGNSTLTLIDPVTYKISTTYQYAQPNAARGYDDVVFLNGKIFLSYTNPTGPSDATIQLLDNSKSPLKVSTILTQGAKGENLATGVKGQTTTQNDPDSLKSTPFGGLMLSSGDDGQLIFVQAPGTPQQSVSFLQLTDDGAPVSGLDDAVWATTPKGVFYLSDTSNNRVLKIEASDLGPVSLFASVGSLNVLGEVNLTTGEVIPFVAGLSGPHGLLFVPDFASLFGH